MSENCTLWTTEDYDGKYRPCQCPNCGGFLPGYFPADEFKCKKCGETLTILYDNKYSGRICKMPDHLKMAGKQIPEWKFKFLTLLELNHPMEGYCPECSKRLINGVKKMGENPVLLYFKCYTCDYYFETEDEIFSSSEYAGFFLKGEENVE